MDSFDLTQGEPKSSKTLIGRCFEVADTQSGADPPADGELRHFYIELLDDGSVALERVDDEGNPTGTIAEDGLSHEEFSSRFKSCSEHECPLRQRTIEEVSKKMASARSEMGEAHLGSGEREAAEDKFHRGLKFDDKNLVAQIGLGKVKMEHEKVDEAVEIFKEISDQNAIYEQSSKHTFNDFAIFLRKKKLIHQAIGNYERAIVIDPFDEILYYNLGRAYWERTDYQKAAEKIIEGLKIASDKKIKFIEGLAIADGKESIEEEMKYLEYTTDIAKTALELFLKDEKEMLERLFSKPFVPIGKLDVGKAKALTAQTLAVLNALESDSSIEHKLGAVNQMENIDEELKERAPDLDRIEKWLSKARQSMDNLRFEDEETAAVDEMYEFFKIAHRKPNIDDV